MLIHKWSRVTVDKCDTQDCPYKSFRHLNMSWQIHKELHKFPGLANKYLWRPPIPPFSLSLVIVRDSFCFLGGGGKINLTALARKHKADSTCGWFCRIYKLRGYSGSVIGRGVQFKLWEIFMFFKRNCLWKEVTCEHSQSTVLYGCGSVKGWADIYLLSQI